MTYVRLDVIKSTSEAMFGEVEFIVPCAVYRDVEQVLSLPVEAIYVGVAGWSRANRGNEFDLSELERAVELAHAKGKRIYLSFNLMPSPFEVGSALRVLRRAMDAGVDAVIASDPSVIEFVASNGCEAHASLGTSTINYLDALFYRELGAKRVVLSPNLSIPEIKRIREEVEAAGIALEVMVRGIKCVMTYLGVCRLSSFFDMLISNSGLRSLIWEGSAKRSGVCFRPCAQEWFTDRKSFYSLAPLNNFELYPVEELVDAGVRHIKIGGRGMPFGLLREIVVELKSALRRKGAV